MFMKLNSFPKELHNHHRNHYNIFPPHPIPHSLKPINSSRTTNETRQEINPMENLRRQSNSRFRIGSVISTGSGSGSNGAGGVGSSSDANVSQIEPQTGRAEVKLNIYDMVSMANFNQYSSPIGFGVFHSGAEIYGCEYAYGGHNNSHSGVFEIAPRDVVVLGEDSFRFRETIVIGYTDFDQDDVKQIVDQLGVKFRGDKYHLLHQNCNHFTDALIKVLCGQGIPSWVNRLAHVSSSLPFLERWLSKYTPLAPNDRDFHEGPTSVKEDETPEPSPKRV